MALVSVCFVTLPPTVAGVWAAALLLAAGRGVGASDRLRVAVLAAARPCARRVGDWSVGPSLAVLGASVPGGAASEEPPSRCALAVGGVVCLRGRKRTTADHLFRC